MSRGSKLESSSSKWSNASRALQLDEWGRLRDEFGWNGHRNPEPVVDGDLLDGAGSSHVNHLVSHSMHFDWD